MRTRTHFLLLVVTALLASAVGSVAAVASTAGTAHACSIAGPYAEVWPSADLQPGQRIELAGWGFNDIVSNAPQPDLAAPGDTALVAPPQLCDFDIVPLSPVDVYWHGSDTTWLTSVSGPDFNTAVVVPANARSGPASISVGPIRLAVSVGQSIEPPPPCPLTLQPDGTAHHVCPEPWPCLEYAASSGTQPAPDADYAPGFMPPCPEPCVDAAHTIDDGTVYDYRWDCPDPCSSIQANPGAARADQAVWCPPPPEPCPAYPTNAIDERSDLSIWCPPPPEPCPAYPTNAIEAQPDRAVWCPPPEPCPMYATDAPAEQSGLSIWCPPPEPCPVYLAGEPAGAEASVLDCPGPCGLVGGDALWCPPQPCPLPPGVSTADGSITADAPPWCDPGPCRLVGGDALVCPEDYASTTQVVPAADRVTPDETPLVPAALDPQEPTRTAAAHVAASLVAAMTDRMAQIAALMVSSVFG